jgi:excisionase family DNA binding protein
MRRNNNESDENGLCAAIQPREGPTMARNEGKELLDKAGAAAYLNTSERHIERLWTERRIAGTKIGRKVRFLQSDLEAFVERSRVDAVR